MKIGITYDLRKDYVAAGFGEEETAEFDSEETITAIDRALQDLGYLTDHIGNVKSLTRRLAAGNSWDLVFNIAEGLKGFGREGDYLVLKNYQGRIFRYPDLGGSQRQSANTPLKPEAG